MPVSRGRLRSLLAGTDESDDPFPRTEVIYRSLLSLKVLNPFA